MDHILYQIVKTILNTFKKQHGENVDESAVEIYLNEIENRIKFKIKNGYSLELSTPEIMKLLGSTKNKITADKNHRSCISSL